MIAVFDGVFSLQISEGAIGKMLVGVEAPFAAVADKIGARVLAGDVASSDATSVRLLHME